jgi:hypothetical protein
VGPGFLLDLLRDGFVRNRLCAYFGGSEEAVDIFEFKRDVKV